MSKAKKRSKNLHLADISRFIYWDPDIGLEQSHFFGFHGSGKSNLAHLVLSYCLDNGEMGLMRGSMNCEWRHFLRYNYPIKMLVPHQLKPIEETVTCLEFESLNALKQKYSFDWEYFNPEDYELTRQLQEGGILVVYDEPFSLAARGWFWAKAFKKLKYRITKHDIPVAFIEHEAGVLFPEIALSESKEAKNHWKAVNQICELFVDFRKNFIRSIMISQMEAEINHRIRGKCTYKIIKKGVVDKSYHKAIVKEAPQQLVNEFISTVGKQHFIRFNQAPKFKEIKAIWKMVPNWEHHDIDLYMKPKDDPLAREKATNTKLRDSSFSLRKRAIYLNRDRKTIKKWDEEADDENWVAG